MGRRETERRVAEYMREFHMTEPGEGVLAAVSGGADSVCLLFLLAELKEELGIRLAAFHLNHGLRGAEADRDETYVREICGRLGVPLSVVRERVAEYAAFHGISSEEAGRILRYRHLEQEAEKFSCAKTAAAHHRDDSAETVVFNLFRGSGLKGLSGIRPVRGKIIRPLLCLTRAEITAYLKERGISWCEDSTNGENQYARNRIRNGLLPWVRENINSRAADHILEAASLAAQADGYFTALAEEILAADGAGKILGEKDAGGCAAVSTEVFDCQPPVVKAYLVRALIARVEESQRDISSRHVEAVCGLSGPGGGTKISLPGGLEAARGYDRLTVYRKDRLPGTCQTSGSSREPASFRITETEETEKLPALAAVRIPRGQETEERVPDMKFRVFPYKKTMEIPKNQYTKWFDYDRIKGTLSVRNRESGDYLMIAGGKKKLLKRFFIDEKIPEGERASIPLLAEGSHVLWVTGYRISEFYKVTEKTCTILEVQVCKGEENG